MLCNTKNLPVEGQPDFGACSIIVLKDASGFCDKFIGGPRKTRNSYNRNSKKQSLFGCSIKTEKELKKESSRSFEEKEARIERVDVRVARWFDNSAVTTASITCTSVQLLLFIER